jgi:hypothetical protein
LKLANIKSDDVNDELFLYAVEQYKLHNKDKTVDISIIQEEYQRFWFIIKLLAVYRNSSELNVRLLLNHLIILTNLFEISAVTILLRIALDKGDYDIITYVLTLLSFIGYIPDDKHMYIMSEEYLLNDIPVNSELLRKLENETTSQY